MEEAALSRRLEERAGELAAAWAGPALLAALAALFLLGLLLRSRRLRPAPPQPLPPPLALPLAAAGYAAFLAASVILEPALRPHPFAEPLRSLLVPLSPLALLLWAAERALPGGVRGLFGDGVRRAVLPWAVAVLVYVAGFPVFVLLQQVELFPTRLQAQVLDIAATADALYRGLYGLAVVGPVPFFEEVLFRGLLLRAGLALFGSVGGVVFSAAVFALVHPPPTWLAIFWLGLLLGGIALWTGRLLAAVFFHALHNATQFFLVLLLSS